MRITSKGQVTIPVHVREKLGLLPDTEVEFEIVGNSARIKKVGKQRRRGRRIVDRMRGRATVKLSTDEILALTRS